MKNYIYPFQGNYICPFLFRILVPSLSIIYESHMIIIFIYCHEKNAYVHYIKQNFGNT